VLRPMCWGLRAIFNFLCAVFCGVLCRVVPAVGAEEGSQEHHTGPELHPADDANDVSTVHSQMHTVLYILYWQDLPLLPFFLSVERSRKVHRGVPQVAHVACPLPFPGCAHVATPPSLAVPRGTCTRGPPFPLCCATWCVQVHPQLPELPLEPRGLPPHPNLRYATPPQVFFFNTRYKPYFLCTCGLYIRTICTNIMYRLYVLIILTRPKVQYTAL